jgi:poly(3-hydroxyalkanoate) synthetase
MSPESLAELPTPDPALLAGIAAYRRHPFFREMPEPPTLWEEGGSRLLDYGPPDGAPLLVVPSLINRAYVMDLLPGHSMMRFLAERGVRPLLLDWGWPGEVERDFTLTDDVVGRLERAMLVLGGKIALAGYCMGGLLATAAATRRPDLVSRLALLATPWDFWAADPAAARRLAGTLPWLEPSLAFSGTLPVDALQMLFALLEPGSVAAKYRHFGTQEQDSPRARQFVAIEDWLNDGVPLGAAVARETFAKWYGANAPALGNWRIAGAPVRPETLAMPCLAAIPSRDRIVPPESANALAALIQGIRILTPRAGHVGMIAGTGARAALWEPLLAWLRG